MTKLHEELDSCFRARFTLVVVVTREEERALEAIKAACVLNGSRMVTWDHAEGYSDPGLSDGRQLKGQDPITALEAVETLGDGHVIVLKDFHDCWTNSRVKRKLKNVAQRLRFTLSSIVVVIPRGGVPEELRDDAVVIEFAPPAEEEIHGVLREFTEASGVSSTPLRGGTNKIVRAALGLSISQARRAFSRAIVHDGFIDDRHAQQVCREKRFIVQESEALEYHLFDEPTTALGGLGVLKEYLRMRALGFSAEAKTYGLDSPRGILLIGLPGTGKSLAAKTVASMWGLPLLRLDTGALYHSLVGESEHRVRRALAIVDAACPCVLWIDEIEKAFSVGGLDGGTSMRVLGTILTWMQEKTSACFVVATANAVDALPAELLRKGRFDEIFFLDLPTAEERREIAEIHITKRGRLSLQFDLALIAAAADGHVGAEIEQAIVEAMWVGFDQQREFTTEDVIAAVRRQVPLSRSHAEAVRGLRSWLREGRARSASFEEGADAEARFVAISRGDPVDGNAN